MSFEKYILEIRTANGKIFKAEKIQITPASLEKHLERAFWAGFKHSEELSKNLPENKSLFENIFGKL